MEIINKYIVDYPIEYLHIADEVSRNHKSSLPLVFIKLLFSRFVNGFGAKDYALHDLEAQPLRKWSSFASKNQMMAMQRKINSPEGRDISNDKLRFFSWCRGHNLATPTVYAVIGEYPDTLPDDVATLDTEEKLKQYFQQHNEKKRSKHLIVKETNGSWGKNMMLLKVHENCLTSHEDKPLSYKSLLRFCTKNSHGKGFLLQERLFPHEDLKDLMRNDTLGTFRVITFNRKHDVAIPFGYFKIPVGETKANDNFAHGQSGNLAAAIDTTTGKLRAARGPAMNYHYCLRSFSKHPDTGKNIENFVVPNWFEICELARKAALALPELTTVGWDIALSRNGIVLIEANDIYDADAIQVSLGRGIKHDIVELMQQIDVPAH